MNTNTNTTSASETATAAAKDEHAHDHDHKDGDAGDCSCPICLEPMTVSETRIYPLPCRRCDFNFCSNCVENFCAAAEDDYQMASDGSRQVKITVSCPQCRSGYPVGDLEETVLLLRSAHALADSVLKKVLVVEDVPEAEAEPQPKTKTGETETETESESESSSITTAATTTTTNATATTTTTTTRYKLVRDSELSAGQLSRKSEFASQETREQLREASLLYEKAISESASYKDDESARARRDSARDMWLALLDQLPAEPDNACRCEDPQHYCDGSCGCRNSIEVVLQPTGSFPSSNGGGGGCGDSNTNSNSGGINSSSNSNSNSGSRDSNNANNNNNAKAKANQLSKKKAAVVDETLFQGFDEFMNKDEKTFLTDLFTGGDVRSVSQAALIMHGVRRLALTGKHTTPIRSQQEDRDRPKTKHEIQKHIESIDQMKVQFPLPNHMPGYFLIPTYSYKQGYMTLRDKPWDGTMTPPQRSKRVFEQVYKGHYERPKSPSEYPLRVASVQAVKGPIGRLGLRRDDIITHVDDTEWHGTAEDLQDYIYECHAKHPRNEISITVNVTPETCTFLKVRNEMMQRRIREQRERAKQKALLRNKTSVS